MAKKIFNIKPWYKSKTLWAGTFQILGGILISLSGELSTGSTLTLAGVVTIILRIVTKSSLASQ
jgi:hypothetical protein